MSEGAFFQDLAVLMVAAGLVSVVFTRFGWPKAIGYILAGIVMSPYTWGGSFLRDVSSTNVIGQLGVVFLMFGMGLSFSAKDMKKIRGVALPCALLDAGVMIWLGYMVGTKCFGWGDVPSLFLGVAICDSATTLLAKVIDEMGWSDRPFSKYVLGTSVCEDIICVGAIAMATGFAKGQGMSLAAFGTSLGGLFVFFLTALVLGFVLVPRLLKSVAKRNDDESLILAILGCCFGVSYFAYRLDYSLALGAFLVGVLGSVSCVRERLTSLADPLKSMFSSVFFVSIGLLVDPAALWHNLPEILLVACVVVGGKLVNNLVGSLLCGVNVKTSVQNAFGLAQIGEFAFMVAMLYAGLQKESADAARAVGAVVPDDPASGFFAIAIGASLLTTVLNPFMIRISDKVGDWAEENLPPHLRKGLETYWAWLEKIKSQEGSPAFASLRMSVIRFSVYAVLMFGGYCIAWYLKSDALDYTKFSGWFNDHKSIVFFALANLFSIGLLPIALREARTMGDLVGEMLAGRGDSRGLVAFRKTARLCVILLAAAAFITLWSALNVTLLPDDPATRAVKWGAFAVTVVVAAVGWKYLINVGCRAIQRFNEALTEEERREGLEQTTAVALPQGDDFHRFVLTADSPAVGGTVVSLNIRAKTGASIVAVVRDGQVFRNVGPDIEFKIGDELVALGDAHQTGALKDLLGVTA
jgi:monovalent cation:H+ antiporter-2, CPA2 family